MLSPTRSTRPPRWFRSALLLLAALVCTLCIQGAYAQTAQTGTNADPGVTFDYKIGWVNVESATFGISLLAKKKSTYVEGSAWSVMIRYDDGARANITRASSDWKLGYYDHSSWVLVPGSEPFVTMYYVVHSSGTMNTEDTITELAIPKSVYFLHSDEFSTTVGSTKLENNKDYFVNVGVNLAENPKVSYGPWERLEQRAAEVITSSGTSASAAQTSQSRPVDKEVNEVVTDSLDEPLPTSTGSSSSTPTATSPSGTAETAAASSAPSPLETVLPPVKFIKGDPNYDPNVDVLGTMLAAPKTGLYLTSIILGIGFIAHAIGTYQRFQYQREYRLSLQRSKDAHFRA